jgi:eukaryotic-like serine/threonine-protein kinase
MGEVYRARDTKLTRDVAIKVLLPAVATDPDRLARFSREAQVLASLNHPNIAAIYGIEESGGVTALVMELVEGEDLSQRIARGAIPTDEALPIARQIAEALEAAHDHGIIHRDLKPANIKVRPDGTVKVLDFGLAKAIDPTAGSSATAMNSPTLSIHATQAGIILGTAAYMSPEQARGKSVDKRTDIWAFGAVLFEMLTGMRAFLGDDATDTIVAVISKAPDWSALPLGLSDGLRQLLRRCLEKDPKGRLDSAAAVRIEIDDARAAEPAAPAKPAKTSRAIWVVAVVALAGVVALGWWFSRSLGGAGLAAPPLMTFDRLSLQQGISQQPSVSPDGKWVVYVAGVTDNTDVFLQSTTGQASINLTKDSLLNDFMPAFSPDGDAIVFRSDRDGGGLFVMGRTGEAVRRLTSRGFNPAWFPDGQQIVFATESAPAVEARAAVSELWVVPVAGGEPRRLFAGDAVQPRVSPSGRRIAFWSIPADAAKGLTGSNRDVWTIAADGTDPVRVTNDAAYDWNPIWSPDGTWLHFLSDRSGSMNLWRVSINESNGVTAGDPQPTTVPASYIRHFSLSSDGRVGSYATWAVTSNIGRVRFDAQSGAVQGPLEPVTAGPHDFATLDISPDGQQLVVHTSGRQREDLYVMSSDGSGIRQLTSGSGKDRVPRWSSDGRQILFYSDRSGTFASWRIDRDGGGLTQLPNMVNRTYPLMSHDGAKIAAIDSEARIYLHDPKDFSRAPEALPPVPDDLRSSGLFLNAWSPDNRFLGGSTDIGAFVYSLDTHSYSRIGGAASPSDSADSRSSSLTWLPDGRRFVFARRGRLFLADRVAGAAREVFAIAGETITFPRLSRDGSFLYFEHGSASGDIWMVKFGEEAAVTHR